MTFPQPSANQYAVNGSQFFRLNTLLASPGDIYESAQSGHAFALGPESDISNVALAYFDAQAPNFMNQLSLTPDKGMVGRLDANNLGTYSPSNRPARLLMWSGDLWNPQYTPTGGPPAAGSSYILETPRLDVIEYFKPQSSLVPKRRDKTWIYQSVLLPVEVGTGSAYITIPYYGRKYAEVIVDMPSASRRIGTYNLYGVNLIVGQNSAVDAPSGGAWLLDTGATIRKQLSIVNAGDKTHGGVFDLLVVQLSGDSDTPAISAAVKIFTSDTSSPE